MEISKPVAALIGANGNIFNLMAIASKTLKDNRMLEESKRMMYEVKQCTSYDEALNIIGNYVEFGEANIE